MKLILERTFTTEEAVKLLTIKAAADAGLGPLHGVSTSVEDLHTRSADGSTCIRGHHITLFYPEGSSHEHSI